jgi:hypothetical protein
VRQIWALQRMICFWVHVITFYQQIFHNFSCLYEDTSSLFHEPRNDLMMGISKSLNGAWYIYK